MLWAKQHGGSVFDRFVDHAYARFWRRDLDIENVEVLTTALEDVGAEAVGFESFAAGPGRALHDADNLAAFDAGVFGVPTYLVADEVWFGREHLPRVEWLLMGGAGSAPRVSNRAFPA